MLVVMGYHLIYVLGDQGVDLILVRLGQLDLCLKLEEFGLVQL